MDDEDGDVMLNIAPASFEDVLALPRTQSKASQARASAWGPAAKATSLGARAGGRGNALRAGARGDVDSEEDDDDTVHGRATFDVVPSSGPSTGRPGARSDRFGKKSTHVDRDEVEEEEEEEEDDNDGTDAKHLRALRRKGERVAAAVARARENKRARAQQARDSEVQVRKKQAVSLASSRVRVAAVRVAAAVAPDTAAAPFAAAVTSFADPSLALPAPLVDALASQGLHRPTAIQALALPALLSGRDALLGAQTGSGKTLAYAVPIVRALVAGDTRVPRSDGTHAVIVAPTRELCQQIDQVVRGLLRPYHWLVSTILVGGESRKSEKARLRRGVHIVIGTPGRLLDHLQHTQSFRRDKLHFLVLDEADRLLDMGFLPSLHAILDCLGGTASADGSRVSVLCSATLDGQITTLAQRFLHDPVTCDVRAAGLAALAPPPAPPAGKVQDRDGDSDGDNENDGDGDGDDDGDCDGDADHDGDGAAAVPAQLNANATPSTLHQYWIEVPTKLRLAALIALLRREALRAPSRFKAIVFVSPCATVSFLHAVLTHGYSMRMSARDVAAAYRGSGGPGSEDGQGGDADALAAALRDVHDYDVDEGAQGMMRDAMRDVAAAAASLPHHGSDLLLASTPVYALHGQMPQTERSQVFLDFCAAPTGVLLSTDVAARGLDLPALDWIVQYDAPTNLADYVHRVGRTARMGRRGNAVLFLSDGPETGLLDPLRARGLTLDAMPLPRVLSTLAMPDAAPSRRGARAPRGKAADLDLDAAARVTMQIERAVASEAELGHLARDAFTAHVRAYATHSKETKPYFHVKNLHLGHVAKAFALRDTPSLVAKHAVPRGGGGAAGAAGARAGSKHAGKRKRAAGAGRSKSACADILQPARKRQRTIDTRMPG